VGFHKLQYLGDRVEHASMHGHYGTVTAFDPMHGNFADMSQDTINNIWVHIGYDVRWDRDGKVMAYYGYADIKLAPDSGENT
jgi:hypothetical protein